MMSLCNDHCQPKVIHWELNNKNQASTIHYYNLIAVNYHKPIVGGSGQEQLSAGVIQLTQNHGEDILSLLGLHSAPEERAARRKVNGEDLLIILSNYLRRSRDRLNRGEEELSLNPSCLNYLAEVERKSIEGSIWSPPHSHSTGSVDVLSNLSSGHLRATDVVFVLNVLHGLKLLKIEPCTAGALDKNRFFTLHAFHSLRALEVNFVKPALIVDLYRLSKQLRLFIIGNSLASLDELLVFDEGDDEEGSEGKPWENLMQLSCAHNFIPRIDESLKTLTQLQRVDFSYNLISKLENTEYCYNLVYLNLANNRIASVATINLVLGNISILILRNNMLTSMSGLEKLYNLQKLDLSGNHLSDRVELRLLGQLPVLTSLWLHSNPLSHEDDYRHLVLTSFEQDIVLDGVSPSVEELLRKREEGLLHAPETPEKRSHRPSIVPRRKKGSARKKVKRSTVVLSGDESGSEDSVTHDLLSDTLSSSTATDGAVLAADAELEQYRKHVEELHKMGGSSWLLILDGLQSADEEKKAEVFSLQEALDKHNELRQKSMEEEAESALETIEEALEANLQEQLETGEAEYSRNAQRGIDEAAVTPVASRSDRSSYSSDVAEADKVSGNLSSVFDLHSISAPLPAISFSPPLSPNRDSTMLEGHKFIVLARDVHHADEWHKRLVVITARHFVEADVSTGNVLLRVALPKLKSIRELQFSQEDPPIVSLTFSAGLPATKADSTAAFTCLVYKLESSEMRDHFLEPLQPWVAKSFHFELECMACSHRWDEKQSPIVCPECGKDIVLKHKVEDVGRHDSDVLDRGSRSKERGEVKKDDESRAKFMEEAEQFKGECGVDINTQLQLRLFLGCDAKEVFITVVVQNMIVLQSGSSPSAADEESVLLVLSNQQLYLIRRVKDKVFTLIGRHPLNEILHLVIGLYHSYFTIVTSTQPPQAYMVLTRNQSKTQALVQEIIDVYERVTEKSLRAESHASQTIVDNFDELFGGKNHRVMLYVLLFVSNAELINMNYKGVPPVGFEGRVAPRTLVITREQLVLTCDDYGIKRNSQQFSCSVGFAMSDVVSVMRSKVPNLFSIVFEDGAQPFVSYYKVEGAQRWNLITDSEMQRERIIGIICKAWKALFKLSLTVVDE